MYVGVGSTSSFGHAPLGAAAFGAVSETFAVKWLRDKLKDVCQGSADYTECRIGQMRSASSEWSNVVAQIMKRYLEEGKSTKLLINAIAKEVMYDPRMTYNEAVARLQTIEGIVRVSMKPKTAYVGRTMPVRAVYTGTVDTSGRTAGPAPEEEVYEEEVFVEAPEEEEPITEPNYLLYGGIAVVALGLGAVMWKRKK